MKHLYAALATIAMFSGGVSSSSLPAAEKSTTVVVQPNSEATVVCSDGTQPPCK